MGAKVRRALIYRLGSLGDTVVALPALHLVARAFPDAERRLLTNFPEQAKAAPAAAVLDGSGLVDSYLRYGVGSRNPLELLALWFRIMRWRPQVLVYLAARRGIKVARRDAWFFRLCGVSRLIGVPVTDAMQQAAWLEDQRVLEPECERLAGNLGELGVVDLYDPASWDLRLTREERERAQAALAVAGEPLIAVSVGTKMQSKDWGKENWRALLGRLGTHYPGYGLALCGAADEAEASEFAATSWMESGGGPVVNLCGQLTPRESAAVFERARVFLGHDSGPMHLAAAVQTPCVAIFSSRNKPRVWFPYGRQHRVLYHQVECWGCNLETCIVEKKRCIYSIGVDEVLNEVRGVLG